MKKRVHVLFEHGLDGIPYGAGHIRLLCPLSHPSLQDKVSFSHGTDMPDFSVDVVIVERGWRHNATLSEQARLLEYLSASGTPYIYEIDDNLLDLNSGPGAPGYPSPEQRQIIMRFARNAAGLIVSTLPLKHRMTRLNSNIEVVENCLDERLFDFDLVNAKSEQRADAKRAGLVIGYMGTYSHLEDLLAIVEPLRGILRERRDSMRMEIVGIGDEALIRGLFDGLPVSVVKVPDGRVEYPAFMKWMQREIDWDFAIAPLIDSEFNRCKSDVKFLDYSLNRIPGIYSATQSYSETVVDKQNGLLVPADRQAWRDALALLADDSALRRTLSENAFSYVRAHRTLETKAVRWLKAIEVILAAGAHGTRS
ncbi:processive 1,2-diacylglycerol beta-glucosyltransferase [Variovorax sp. TBS-050B]|uniref:hypothetical protein n=1 Tax=Variovorax sp. TBS-050B TaxID=2940551 RepID=UPI002473732E|nr:hypothetical protein [Variovorax sp. TBS-050B]MDH6592683.1 processive 1,2-diacylglycerol beta-glucosyltransferase [Variovorax sp. TBS-050B]